MTTRNSLAQVIALLRDCRSCLIVSHIGPDGDAIGSTLGLCSLVQALGCERVMCCNQDPVPERYAWLPGADQVHAPEDLEEPAQVAVIVDVSEVERVGRAAHWVEKAQTVVVLDHHLSNHVEGDLNFTDSTYAAVGEIIVELYEQAGVEMSPEAAQCLYVALASDTGGFRFSNTTARSHRAAARLLERDIDVAWITFHLFETMPLRKYRLMTRVLDATTLVCGNRVGYAELWQKDLDETQATPEDTDGLINYLRNIDSVEVAILFRETSSGKTKVSMRSGNGFNSAALLRPFGGGGHAPAAGATIDAPLEETRKKVLEAVEKAIEGPNP